MFDGVWFISYVHDHLPPHVHGRYAGVEAIIDLRADGTVRQSDRWDAVTPSNGKRSDVRRILETAKTHGDELLELWRSARG